MTASSRLADSGKGRVTTAVSVLSLVTVLGSWATPAAAQIAGGGSGGTVSFCGFPSVGGGSGYSGASGSDGIVYFGCAGQGGGGGAAGGGSGGKGADAPNNVATSLGGDGGTAGNQGTAGDTGAASNVNGGGGGGGGGGSNGSITATLTNTAPLAGTAGGAGGNGGDGGGGIGNGGAGGGGGAGGYGAVVTGSGASSNTSSISGGQGGQGGSGGAGFSAGYAGAGGTGGIGVYFTSPGATFTNTGTVLGGNGGAGGNGSTNGAGGAGIYGAGLTIINSGTITGGMGGDGVTQADAITFTGGANTLTLQNGSTINGNIAIGGSGSLTFNQSTAQTLGSVITGNGAVIQNGAGTLTLTGTNTYSGGTTITAGAISAADDIALGTGAVTLNGGTLARGGSIITPVTLANTFSINTTGGTLNAAGGQLILTGAITDGNGAGGVLTIHSTGLGSVAFASSGANTYSGATIIGDGTTGGAAALLARQNNALSANSAVTVTTNSFLDVGNASQTIGSLAGAGTVNASGTAGVGTLITGGDNSSTTFSGVLSDGGATLALTKAGTGTMTLTGASNYSGGTTISGGTLQIGNGGTSGSITGDVTNNATLAFDRSDAVTFGNVISGTGSVTQSGTGTLILTGGNIYTGATSVNRGTLAGGAANAFSPTSATQVNAGGTLDLGGFAQTINTIALAGGTLTNGALTGAVTSTGGAISGISGAATLTTTSGITTVTGINTFAGPTTVNGGTLVVNGSLTDPTVNAGGTLTGTGSVGDTTVNGGGIFAPGYGTAGSSMTVNGDLTLQSAATYLVQVNPATASFATVTGTATLGGATVSANFATGSYIARQYTILTAGAVQGTFGALVNTALPANFSDTLSYDATHAYLNLALNFVPPTAPGYGNGLNTNQQHVANTLVNYFNTTGGIPLVFGALNAQGLTQASGELGAGSQQTTFDAMNMFMGLMSDPFSAGRDAGGQGALGYADEALGYAGRRAPSDAFAMFAKAPPKAFEARWTTWAAGFGGSRSTDGNAVTGSNNTTSSIYDTAVGADYWFSPSTVAGFSMAGGGTNFSVANGGSGHSDLFQAGTFVRHTEGSAYVTAAAAYGWQTITTDRIVSAGITDRLHAAFNANAYSGRVEAGNRWLLPAQGGIGITPYAAVQVTAFDLPAYAETSAGGATTFALAYAGKMVTDTRSELGLRSDKSFAVNDAMLTLRGRAAWAHDFNADRSVQATFQSLPGASFIVNGAALAHDAALTTASAELRWTNGWSVAATFDGEFSNVTESYSGKGVIRYAW